MTCWNICKGFVWNAYLTLSLDLFGIQIASGVDLNSASVSQEIYVYTCCKLPACTLRRGRGAVRTDFMPGKSSGTVNEYGLYPFSVQCSLFSKWELAAEFGGWHFLGKPLLWSGSCSDEHSEIAPQKILFFDRVSLCSLGWPLAPASWVVIGVCHRAWPSYSASGHSQ